MMKCMEYDVFSGSPDKDPFWLEASQDLAQASEHMKQRADKNPGKYFVYSCRTAKVMDRIDTSVKPAPNKRFI